MNNNMDIWSKLGKTDPKHTKQFTRAGGFKGTAVKPMYSIQKMTEVFGPCGDGWGINEPSFQVIPGPDNQVLVYCTVSVWYDSVKTGRQREPSAPVYGVGGDFAVTKRNDGKMFCDDEAFKKAFTDAVGNALKSLGMAADVHMGQFDDSKYVAQLRDEFSDDKPKSGQRMSGPLTITALKDELRDLAGKLAEVTDDGELHGVRHAYKDVIEQCQRDLPDWWDREGDGAGGLKQRLQALEKQFGKEAAE